MDMYISMCAYTVEQAMYIGVDLAVWSTLISSVHYKNELCLYS